MQRWGPRAPPSIRPVPTAGSPQSTIEPLGAVTSLALLRGLLSVLPENVLDSSLTFPIGGQSSGAAKGFESRDLAIDLGRSSPEPVAPLRGEPMAGDQLVDDAWPEPPQDPEPALANGKPELFECWGCLNHGGPSIPTNADTPCHNDVTIPPNP